MVPLFWIVPVLLSALLIWIIDTVQRPRANTHSPP